MPRSILIAALVAMVPLQAALAQTRTQTWQDGLCHYSVRYDPRKIDPAALQGTIALLNTEQNTVPIGLYPATPKDVAKLDPARFERDCAAKAEQMRSTKLLPLDGLSDYREERARQIDDACLFGGAKERGYTEPEALRLFTPASPHCDVFVDALEGRTDLTDLWRKRLREQCANNASPGECRKREEINGSRPDGEAWKRLYLIGFGWGNCAVDHARFNGESRRRTDEAGERLTRAFHKAYRVKEACDDP